MILNQNESHFLLDVESFRNYNKPKKRIKPKASKKQLPKTTKGFKNDSR